MSSYDSAFLDLGRLDSLSYGDTSVHRLDPRGKLLASLAFIIVVVSFPKYELVGLIPFFFFPILLVSLADLPVRFLIYRLLVVSPFALCIGIFNPLFDREVLVQLGPLAVAGGWISFVSIMIRFVLTVGIALILVATCSFPGLCEALDRMKVPRVLVVQLMFLYRFTFVLIHEILRIARARSMRSFGQRAPDLRQFVQILGVVFLRTTDRAERVYWSMRNRGFDGEMRTLKRLRFTGNDLFFVLACVGAFAVLRFTNVTELLGMLALKAFG